MKKIGSSISYLVLIVILSVVIIYLLVGIFKQPSETEEVKIQPDLVENSVDVPETEDEPVIIIDTISEGLNNMGVLVTQEYYFTMVEEYTDADPLFDNIKWTKFLKSTKKIKFQYDGSVTAGVDFSKVQIEQEAGSNKLIISMPNSEIQTIEIDNDSFELLTEKDGLWNKVTMEDYNTGVEELKKEAEAKALENEILEKADENARELVENMIIGIVGNDVSLEFE